MAKREMSSTLKNLKFMQRATQKEELPKKEEVIKVDGNFVSPDTQKRKCIVIVEGNPHPGALKGRMSFERFNPSIDKVNEAAANPGQTSMPSRSSDDGKTSSRENGSLQVESESTNLSRPDSEYDGELERKQPEIVTETQHPNKSPRNLNGGGGQQSSNKGRGSHKKQKREKLDWNLLRPPKASKRQG